MTVVLAGDVYTMQRARTIAVKIINNIFLETPNGGTGEDRRRVAYLTGWLSADLSAAFCQT
jgi:hypothetical protein